jgi:hypothetical protein
MPKKHMLEFRTSKVKQLNETNIMKYIKSTTQHNRKISSQWSRDSFVQIDSEMNCGWNMK